jgi:hypothetical protein
MTNLDHASVTLVFSLIDSPEVEYSVEGGSVDDVVVRLYDACQLHGDIVLQPFSDGQTTLRNVTQVFAQGLNNAYDDIEATWEESGRVVIRAI